MHMRFILLLYRIPTCWLTVAAVLRSFPRAYLVQQDLIKDYAVTQMIILIILSGFLCFFATIISHVAATNSCFHDWSSCP